MQLNMKSTAKPTKPLTARVHAELSPCDCHFHVFNAGESVPGARYLPSYTSTLAGWQVCATRAQVERGVVVQPSFLGTDNRLLLATLSSHPEHLRGVAVVTASANASELEHLHANGVRGIRLNLAGDTDDLRVMRALPASFWSALIAAQLHLELHSDIGRVAALLPQVPSAITVVLDHFAKPELASIADDTVVAVRQRKRAGGDTYITLSGAYRLGVDDSHAQKKFSNELAALWRDELGRERLLWGSDWPCTRHESEANYAALRVGLDHWLPDADDKRAALQSNPQRLYWR